ncbi:hypothetical protein Tco_1550579, partial [Tanacetum coccineum]
SLVAALIHSFKTQQGQAGYIVLLSILRVLKILIYYWKLDNKQVTIQFRGGLLGYVISADIVHFFISAEFTTLRDLLPYVGRSDLVILYGLVMTKYADSPASGLGLDLWGSLRNLIAASETYDASIVWHDQDQWQIHSWRFYGETGVHVLETVDGEIVYMFADKTYPIARSTLQMLLDHGLEIDSYSLRTNATSAVRLIRSLLEQLNPSN